MLASHMELGCPGTWRLGLPTPNPGSKNTPKACLTGNQATSPTHQAEGLRTDPDRRRGACGLKATAPKGPGLRWGARMHILTKNTPGQGPPQVSLTMTTANIMERTKTLKTSANRRPRH